MSLETTWRKISERMSWTRMPWAVAQWVKLVRIDSSLTFAVEGHAFRSKESRSSISKEGRQCR